MKKIVALISLFPLIFGIVGIANAQIGIGQKGEEVSRLQEILKEFPEIYPEGLVTGYFGPLTQKAVKKLQAKCGLPETGIVDEKTWRCIFPAINIEVISPNGGEVWDRNQIQTIKWKVTAAPEEELLGPEKYLWHKASIDLFKRVVPICLPCSPQKIPCICPAPYSVFVKHVAIVDLFDTVYFWRITPDIPNGTDYIIRISTGERIIPMINAERMGKVLPPEKLEEVWPIRPVLPWSFSFDESDGTFTITGEIQTRPDLSETIKILEELIKNLEGTITHLKKTIEMLKSAK